MLASMRRTRSFSTVLYLLFLPLLLGSVGTTGWLAHRAAQESIDEVASALGVAYNARIRESVGRYMVEPQLVTRVNRTEISLGLLDPSDLDALQQRFAQQVVDFGNVAYIYYGTTEGQVVGFQREMDGTVVFARSTPEGTLATYEASEDLTPGALVEVGQPYDPRARPWYEDAVAAGDSTWTDIYVWFGRDELCIDAVAPIYDESGKLLSVLDAGYTLGQLSAFLEGLQIGRTGEAYILDANGLVVANSTGQPLVSHDAGKVRRVYPAEQGTRLSTFLAEALPSVDISAPQSRRLMHPELGAVTLMIHPIGQELGLDWTLAVAIPQSDFTAHYEQLTRQTILLSVLALLMTILAVVVFVRRLSGPIRALVRAAERVRVGDLDIQFPPATRDEIGLLTIAMGEMVVGLRERETIRDAFGRYVTREVAEQVLADPDAMQLGGVQRRVTILMSDLRGFTAQSNRLSPDVLVALLNEYLGEMTEAIVDHDGLIVEFIGDAILVLFGATGNRGDDAHRAVRCAQEMHRRLEVLNTKLLAEGKTTMHMGIGVHTGEVIVGNIGSKHRVKFGVVGDTVNTTARIEALTVGGQTMVGASTRQEIGAAMPFSAPITTRVKGLSEPLVVHELLRESNVGESVLPSAVVEGAAAEVYRVVNKVLAATNTTASLASITGNKLEINSVLELSPLEDVVLAFQVPGGDDVQVYCKVSAVDDASDDGTRRHVLVVTAVDTATPSEPRGSTKPAGR